MMDIELGKERNVLAGFVECDLLDGRDCRGISLMFLFETRFQMTARAEQMSEKWQVLSVMHL
jgi:hypothetical protein